MSRGKRLDRQSVDGLKRSYRSRRPKMNSNNIRMERLEVSWDNIESWIATGIQSLAKGKFKDDEDIVRIKMDYAGGFVSVEKIIPVDIVLQKGVRTIYFG